MLKQNFLILLATISTGVFAQSTNAFNFSLGAVNGKAGEYVYVPETGEKISYLDWKIKNIPVFILGYTHTFNDNIEFQMGLKKNFSSTSSGSMKDYDWYSSYDSEDGATPSDYGKLSNFSSNDNYVDNLLMFDTNVKYWFFHTDNLKSGPMVGLKYDYFKFYAKSGDQYNYTLDGSTTIFKGDYARKSIEYSQKFFTPYIGYGISYTYEKLILDFGINGSIYGKAKAHDKHLERGPMETVEKYKKIKNLGVKLAATYPLTPSIDINGSLEYSKYFHRKKSTTDFTSEDGDKIDGIKNLSGIKNTSYTVAVGVTYKF